MGNDKATKPPTPKAELIRHEFKLKAFSQADEDKYNPRSERPVDHTVSTFGSIAHMVKGALGSGILSLHYGYKEAGWLVAMITHAVLATYMTYNLYCLVSNAQILYKRFRVPSLTYADCAEAAMLATDHPTWKHYGKAARIYIDLSICCDLFGSCTSYQIVIAKTIKQLIEDKLITSIPSQLPGYDFLTLRFYCAAVCLPCVAICLLRHLSGLAWFSIVANCVVLLCIGVTIHYARQYNPGFENLIAAKSFGGFFRFAGMSVFSMSCACIVIPIENHMTHPESFSFAVITGMTMIALATITTAFFGYVAFKEESEAPITINFPMELWPKILKGCMAGMIYVTHAINFWVPFNIAYYYISARIKPENLVKWEYIWRAIIVIILNMIAITFPSVTAIMGVIGTLCLSNIAFIAPPMIDICVRYQRPGYGRFYFHLWKDIFLVATGLFLLTAGSFVNIMAMIETLSKL